MKIKVNIDEIVWENPEKDNIPVTLKTKRGSIICRFYKVSKNNWGAIWVGGVGGDFDTPANGLYPELSRKLMEDGISSLRIQYRYPTKLKESVYDVIAGIKFLESEGISNIALIGHSLGGAVVIQAALMSNSVKTVVTLATQSYGADNVKDLPEETSILLIHGKDDSILPASCSRAIFGMAHDPKERVILSGNGHCLEESADEVKKIVYNWILKLKK
jgi:pimeloyl-ACP methyl ester carboxylesterase